MPDSIAPAVILVVDHDPDLRAQLIDVLSEDGHEVDVTCTGMLALDQLKERPYDLVISALQMRDLDSRAFYHEVAREYPALGGRFLFISTAAPRSGVRAFLRETGAPAFPMPLDVEGLRRKVKATLGLERPPKAAGG